MSDRFPPLAPQEDIFMRPRRARARVAPAAPAAEVWLILAGVMALCLALWGG